ncbi:TPA: hypothetical protein N3414_005183 [Klebsiella quasipneumoniae subsp. quasipneumoniae]|uniref:hypothetical protein n=1 Tax=Klebsiella pneumoniae complex TaxID=3390273 RepID=UPI000E1FC9DC|nr:hypothetical protein [Klebsiella variicola]HBW1846351.1 hypothetical protein [Klebsiella quasipneumoniae subsp. quasipneumoniae]HCM7677891.1 hypothetical protein [Klebsiella quasipneumoniae subsp. quasipneumoniae]
MNAKLALCLLVLPLYSYAMTCPFGIGFSAPQGGVKGEEPYFFTPEGVCLNGRDVSQQLKSYPDDKITGAFSLAKGDGSLFFVSVYSEKHYHGRVILLSDKGKEAGYVVIFQNQAGVRTNNPKMSVENLTINYFDNQTSTLYFSADAWAQARALHAIIWENPSNPLRVTERFIHDGTFQGVFNGMPMVSTIAHDEKGAYFPSYVVRNDGSIYCTINTRSNFWQLTPSCLSPGDDYRER